LHHFKPSAIIVITHSEVVLIHIIQLLDLEPN